MDLRLHNRGTEISGRRYPCGARIAWACGTSGRTVGVCSYACDTHAGSGASITELTVTDCCRDWGGDEQSLNMVSPLVCSLSDIAVQPRPPLTSQQTGGPRISSNRNRPYLRARNQISMGGMFNEPSLRVRVCSPSWLHSSVGQKS
jgi:hypothetical protein